MDRRWHRPRAFALALTLAGIAMFVWLGNWQVRRAHDKEALFAAFAGAASQTPVALDAARRETGAARYPLVRVSGRYDPAHAYVLDNQARGGRAGVMLFDVFEPADGSTAVLANQGFLARDAQGARPAVPPPPPGPQVLTALYAPPPATGLRMGGDALPRQSAWPKTSIYIDPAQIAADLGRRLDARVLLLLPEAGSTFVRDWQPAVFPPQRHYAYAFTWFTFALVSVVLFVVLHWRKAEKP
jgi:cytochrome oxidase assembly protein ShyY1